ncbi:MAG: LPS assembly lipoprotein LptE [Candidatus Poribacteria bacterium]
MYSSFYLILLLVTCLILCGCGYKTKSDLLGHIESVSIPPIANNSNEYALEEDLVKAIKQEFLNKGWGEGADSLFNATIVDYRVEPKTLGRNNQPEQYTIILTLSFVFQDLKRGNKIIRNEKNYVKFYDFYVVEGRGKPPETLKQAKDNLIRETSQDIVSSIVEEW